MRVGFQVSSRASGQPTLVVGGAPDVFLEDVTISNTLGSTQTNVQVSLGLFNFVDGDIPSGTIPIIKQGGTPLADQQVDNEVYFPSGAMAQCTMYCVVPSLATSDASNVFAIYRSTATQSHTAGISWADILAYNGNAFNWLWQAEDDEGHVWNADLRTAGNGGTINGHNDSGPSNYGFFSRGPKTCVWRVAMPLMNGATPHSILRAEFHVYAQLAGGVLLAPRVEAVIFNGSATKENGSFIFRNIYLMKDGQTTSTAAWKRVDVAPAATLTVSTSTGANVNNNRWSVSTSASVLDTVYRGRPLIVSGKGAICLDTFNSATSMSGTIPASQNAICVTQSPTGAGNMTLNGFAVRSGTAKLQAVGGPYMRVAFISADNNSGVTLTITGTTITGADTEAVTGPNNGITYSTKNWASITQIARSGTVSNLAVGTLGFNTASTTASGSWSIFGAFIPQGSQLTVGLLDYATGQPQRYYPIYDATRLANSTVMVAWNFAKIGSRASAVTSTISDLDALPNAGNWGSTKDYNPFYWTSDPSSNGAHKLHLLREPNTGARPEISVMSGWVCDHLQQQTANSYRAMLDVEEGTFSYKRHMMDVNTGLPIAPADRPTFQASDAVFFSNYNSDDTTSGLSSWCYWVTQGAHRGEWGPVGYVFTRRLSFLLALQYASIYTWAEAPSLSADGYDRNYLEQETRGVAWRLRDILNAARLTPATLYNSVALSKSVLQTILDAMTDFSYAKLVIPGPDLAGFYSDAVANTPTKGDFHFVNMGGDGTEVAPWMHNYLMSVLGLAQKSQAINANGTGWLNWQAQLSIDFITKTTSIHPAYFSIFYWMRNDVGGTPKTLSQNWAYVKDTANWASGGQTPWYIQPSGTFTITSGNLTSGGSSVNLHCDTPRFFSDHVGASIVKLSGGIVGVCTITAVTNSQDITVTVNTVFDNNNTFASWGIGLPNSGANSRASFRWVVGAGFNEGYNTDYAALIYAGLSAAQRSPTVGSAAAAAATTVTTWLDSDVSAGAFAWANYSYEIQLP